MADIEVRPLAVEDAAGAWETAYAALRIAGKEYGWDMPALDDDGRDRGTKRVLHVLTHDTAGAFGAFDAGELIGVGLATVRGPLWFLSLLAVRTDVQGKGAGRLLLEATLQTLGEAGTICASDDPKALRRYRAAGFDLDPCYTAKGRLDRALLPAVPGVRAASYADDRELVESVALLQRGAAHGPDLEFFELTGRRLFVADSPTGRGYVMVSDAGVTALGATTAEAAQALLWTALAEAPAPDIELLWLRRNHQWALDVALAARLSLRPSGTFCLRGPVAAMSLYIPSGALG